MSAALHELARAVLQPVDAPASFVRSQVIGPDDEEDAADVDEWVALDAAVARRMAVGGARVVLRSGPGADALLEAPRVDGLALEAVVAADPARGVSLEQAADAVARALDAGVKIRAVLASGATGIDAYRAAAAARYRLGTRVPIRVRWDDVLDVKGAALALTFGADELAGPLAPRRERQRLAQIGGPPEDASRPSPAYVEALIRAAGRAPYHVEGGEPGPLPAGQGGLR
jgi:hypothetical protein